MAPLCIGINALYLIPGEVGGTEIYLRALLRALGSIDAVNHYVLYVNSESAAEHFTDSDRFRVVRCRVRARSRPRRIIYEQTILPWRLHKDSVDVLLNPGFTAPLLFRHSVTVFHDLQHKAHPEFFRRLDLPFWTLFLWLSAIRSTSLIAVSQATAKDIRLHYPGVSARTVVIPHGVDAEFIEIGRRRTIARESRDKFLLTVSTLHPHKNLDRLIYAFQSFRRMCPEYRLVIAGLKGFAYESIQKLILDLGLRGAITITGWIPRAELYRLFETADAYVAPSAFEGFGMPLAEALAAGLPTACSDIPPFRAIAEESALFFQHDSVPGIAAAMQRITHDQIFRAAACTAGPERARCFSWDTAARLTLRQLCLASGRSPSASL